MSISGEPPDVDIPVISSVSNTDGTLTISPTTGAVVASLSTALVDRLTSPTNSINGTQSSGLAIAVNANTNYVFHAHIILTAATHSLTFQIHALAAGAALVQAWGWRIAATAAAPGTTTSVTTNIFGAIASTGTFAVEIYGNITVGANPTTLQIDMVDTAAGDSLLVGSWMQAIPTV